jgi:hypothetical protein
VSIEHEEEEGRETQRHFTSDEELRRPTMARRPEIPCNGLHERGKDAGNARARERCARGLKPMFYRARKGEGVATGANWSLMAMAAGPVSMALKGMGEGEEE